MSLNHRKIFIPGARKKMKFPVQVEFPTSNYTSENHKFDRFRSNNGYTLTDTFPLSLCLSLSECVSVVFLLLKRNNFSSGSRRRDLGKFVFFLLLSATWDFGKSHRTNPTDCRSRKFLENGFFQRETPSAAKQQQQRELLSSPMWWKARKKNSYIHTGKRGEHEEKTREVEWKAREMKISFPHNTFQLKIIFSSNFKSSKIQIKNSKCKIRLHSGAGDVGFPIFNNSALNIDLYANYQIRNWPQSTGGLGGESWAKVWESLWPASPSLCDVMTTPRLTQLN